MTKKPAENAEEDEPEVPIGGVRPVRLRRVQKPKATSRSRKTRRKPANTPGGIHLRANKRLSW